MDTNYVDVDTHRARPHCGFGHSTLSGGICKDRKCGQHASSLFAGYCARCAPKHGISLIKLEPVSAPKSEPALTGGG